jgi:hypothetical protein
MGNLYDQADVFPIIARVIREKYDQEKGLVTHAEIVSALMEDTEAQKYIERARDRQKVKRPNEWIASNMVAWFSQKMTVGPSEWDDLFQREKVNGRWAYRPIRDRS